MKATQIVSQQPHPYISVDEIRQKLCKSKTHVYSLVHAGIIPSMEYGYGRKRKRRIILRSEFERFIDGTATKAGGHMTG